MPTIRSIGTGGAGAGRNYSTIQAWDDAAPVTLTDTWEGECYNDGEFLNTAATILGGSTATSSFYKVLRAATGHGFKDGIGANALRYSATYGVAVRNVTAFTGSVIEIAEDFVRVNGLQISGGADLNGAFFINTGGHEGARLTNCLVQRTAGDHVIFVYQSNNLWLVNNVIIAGGSAAGEAVRLDSCNPARIEANTIVRPSDLATTTVPAIRLFYMAAQATIQNNAIFGPWNAILAGSAQASGSGNNATNFATEPWTGFGLFNKTYTAQFQGTTAAAQNWRVATSGSDLAGAGVRAQTYTADLDILGNSRSLTTPTIGAHEFAAPPAAKVRPSETASAGIWTAVGAATLHAAVSEATASDVEYARSVGRSVVRFKLPSLLVGAGEAVTVKYRASAQFGQSATVRLMQNTTTIATWTHSALPTAPTTYSQPLTSAQQTAITDTTALFLEFEAT